jgi:predicted acyl esterase
MTDQAGSRHGEHSEIADGMRIDWDVPITMSDGNVLRADVFRPVADGRYPVIMTLGPYAKGLPFQTGYAGMWATLETKYPEVLRGSTNKYQNWETPDPEKWVPDGFICVRVDSRGAGRSPGYLDVYSPLENQDFYECIEWAGTQDWSNGKVGLLGISYYAVNQWLVAALQPPHLAAICPFEGYTDFYRECNRHGGILNTFMCEWYPVQVTSVQYGVGSRGAVNPNTGVPIAGSEDLDDAELLKNRADLPAELRSRQRDDQWYRDRSADLSKITVPLLSAGNWAHALHSRGNFEGYLGVSSVRRWLEVHGLEHWTEFYTDYGVALQKRFFGHFLRGEDTGWDAQPPVYLKLRAVDGTFTERAENEWPLARTAWTEYYPHPDGTLATTPPAAGQVSFDALGSGVSYFTEPLAAPMEITGPAAATLFVSSSTTDADLFITLRVQDTDGADVTFVSAQDPKGVITNGWLRASARELDEARSLPGRPWHTHQSSQPLTHGEVVRLDVEIWPTSVLVPAGYRVGVTIGGRDFVWDGDGPWPRIYGIDMRGNGIFYHNDPADRPADVFGGTTTLHMGQGHPSRILLPVIPSPVVKDREP